MKKILLLLVLLILLPITTNAASNVEIKDLTFISKSDNTEIVQDAKVDGLKLNFNLKFYQVGDNAKYKFTIKNNSTKDYEIETGTSFSKDKVIKYEFQVDGNNKILKAKEEKNMTVTISYNIKVDDSKYVDGKYIAEDTLDINLSNDKISANPKTANNKIIIAIVIMLVISTIAVLVYSQKQTFLPLVILLLILPVATLALEKITINVDSKVEIEEPEEIEIAIRVDETRYPNVTRRKNMNLKQVYESDYINVLAPQHIKAFRELLLNSGTYGLEFRKNGFDECNENASTGLEKEECKTNYTEDASMNSIVKDNMKGYYYIHGWK